MQYGGFWVRVGAYLIDLIILMIVTVPLAFLLGDNPFDTSPDAPVYGASDIVGLVIGIAYFVGFESSSMQATPGKSALGLVVTDVDGRRISALRALGRYFAKILSSLILLIGYIMIAFTDRKQGLHDLICSTLVVHGKPGETGVDPDVFS